MSKVIVHRRAAKYLQRIPTAQKEQIKSILRQLQDGPLGFPGVRRMAGQWAGYHRIRAGNVRIIFWFDETLDIVYVDHVGPRGDVYK